MTAFRRHEAVPAMLFGAAMAVVPLAVLRTSGAGALAVLTLGLVGLATVPRLAGADVAAVLIATGVAAGGVFSSAPYAGPGAGATAVLGYVYLAVADLGRCPPTAGWVAGAVLTALGASALCAGVLLAVAVAPTLPGWVAGVALGALLAAGLIATLRQVQPPLQ